MTSVSFPLTYIFTVNDDEENDCVIAANTLDLQESIYHRLHYTRIPRECRTSLWTMLISGTPARFGGDCRRSENCYIPLLWDVLTSQDNEVTGQMASFVRFSFLRLITLVAAHRVQECGLVRKRC